MRGTAVAWGAHTRGDRPTLYRVPAPAVAPRSNPGDGVALGLLGALLDVPDLFDNPEVIQLLSDVDGPLALAIAAARFDSIERTIEHTPELFRSFVSRRLTEPEHETIDEGLRWFKHYAIALARSKRSAKRRATGGA